MLNMLKSIESPHIVIILKFIESSVIAWYIMVMSLISAGWTLLAKSNTIAVVRG